LPGLDGSSDIFNLYQKGITSGSGLSHPSLEHQMEKMVGDIYPYAHYYVPRSGALFWIRPAPGWSVPVFASHGN
jgi:hypothetical protein